ncbi:glycosyltransferase [Terrimonas alba]|uniref:glycosyltransferase n=1 Tax=Terrimonas alba TaxID=3349636 RepID=UPI0035F43E9C
MKQILYLSYTGMTDPLGQSQVLAYLKGLSQTEEYRFTIISFEKAEAYSRLHTTIETFCNEAGIKWYPLSYTSRPPVVSTFRDVRRMKKLAFALHKKEKFSLVHCRSYIASLAGLDLKRKTGIPFLFDMRGFWADERIDGGIWKKSNPVFKFIYDYFKKKEKHFLLEANHVVSLTQNARDEIQRWRLGSADLSITVIPCCADMELFDPLKIKQEQQEELRSQLNIPANVPVISYIGSLGTWYMLEEMLALVKVFQEKEPAAIFMVLTGEPEQMVLDAALVAGLNLANLRIKKVSRNQMPLYISLSNCSVFFIKPAYSKKASSPVKQGELMAMGIPIICNNQVGDTEEIVEKYGAGVVVKEFSTPAYAAAIEAFSRRSFDKQQITGGAKDFFSLERGVQLYRQVYKTIENG